MTPNVQRDPSGRQHPRSFVVHDALWDRAKAVSEKLNVSVSELLRSGLKRELAVREAEVRSKGL